MKTVYLDNAATTPVLNQAKDAFIKACDLFANPSSAHTFGQFVAQKIQAHRERFFYFLSAKKTYDFIFTSSATESNNIAILGHDWQVGDEVIYTDVCHPSQVRPIEMLQQKFGVVTMPIPLLDGEITEAAVVDLISDKTKLIVLHHVNGQTGQIVKISSIADRVRSLSGAHIHIDAVQSFTKHNLSLEDNLFDSISISSHKIGGVKGIAGLYLKKYSLNPIFLGGGQEFGIRSSTESIPLIASFAAAANYRIENKGANKRKLERIYAYAVGKLSEKGAIFPFKGDISPYILTFIYEAKPAKKLIEDLGRQGICFSSTSACSSKKADDLKIFANLGIPERHHEHVVRLSFSPETTEQEIDKFISALN